MRRRRGGGRRGKAAALVAACFVGVTPASARPLQVEDVLQREGIGQVIVSPDDHWMIVERRGPYASGGRYDYDRYNDAWRTTLCGVDLTRPGPCEPLFQPEVGVGYLAGPVSPDGARLLVYRFRTEGLSLGVVTLATGDVRWLDVTPELALFERTLQWISPTVFLAISPAAGEQPFELRWVRPAATLPARWAATAAGGSAQTVVGSGAFLNLRPHDKPRRLVRVDAVMGTSRILTTGALVDLEVSASGRRIAVLEDGPDIPLDARHAVQGDYGIATHRRRLRILDLQTGAATDVGPQTDILAHLVSWSPAADRLLVFARTDGEPWSQGRLLVVDGSSGAAQPLDSHGVVPEITGRPEIVRAGWLGRDPLVFGRRGAESRADWYRLSDHGARALTRRLANPPRDGLAITPDAALAAADGVVWRLEADGKAEPLLHACVRAFAPAVSGLRTRNWYNFARGALIGLETRGAAARLVRVDGLGAVTRLDLPPNAALLAVTRSRLGAVVEMFTGGGDAALLWVQPGELPLEMLRFNRHLAEVDRPIVQRVTHPGPQGQSLASWLLLPPDRGPAATAPPLVVWPYLGQSFPTPPASGDIRNDALGLQPPLLVGHGYAVLLPSLPPVTGDDPAAGLADRVLGIIAAADRQHPGAFDAKRIGVWGHSYGGYSTLAMLTQTDRFKVAIAAASPSDLFSMAGDFSPARRAWPQDGVAVPWAQGWVEDLQGGMKGPPWIDPARYLRNSPALHTDRIVTPLMLVHGDQDGIGLQQSEEVFSGLFRQNKDAVLLTYWGEGHSIHSPGNIRDLYVRAFAWLDAVLKPVTPENEVPPPHPEPASASAAPRTRSPPP